MRIRDLILSIIIVSLSGALKLQFAYDFLGDRVPLSKFIAAALIACAAYAFDRGVDNKEDEARESIFKKLLLGSVILCTIASFVLYPNPALLIPFLIAYMYTKGLKGHRLKGGMGVKNVVVALTWSLGIIIILGIYSLPVLLLCVFFFCKSFVNTVIYDVRDIEQDRTAGITTIPTVMTVSQLTIFLLLLSLAAHITVLGAYSYGLIGGGRRHSPEYCAQHVLHLPVLQPM